MNGDGAYIPFQIGTACFIPQSCTRSKAQTQQMAPQFWLLKWFASYS